MSDQLIGSILEAINRGSRKSPTTIAVVGGQWGDEGKGKMVDLLASWANIVARGTGGANAGHTIQVDGKEIVLHLIPSGIHYDSKRTVNVCGNGMVIDPDSLLKEMKQVKRAGLTTDHLLIAHNANLVLPQHILLDKVKEKAAGKKKIGTTGRGIGPAYIDKVARIGMVMNDLLNPDAFREKLRRNLSHAQRLLQTYDPALVANITLRTFHSSELNERLITDRYLAYGEVLKGYISDTDRFMREARGNTNILLEGAQGILLGINEGTYPHVTCADCSVAGLARGVGLREADVDRCVVVAKAFYMTRVGAGPFPTELGGEQSAIRCNSRRTTRKTEQKKYPHATVNSKDPYEQGVGIRQAGGEYGATTGRPRRTGWLDLPALRYVMERCGNKAVIALTKVDILDECNEIELCHGYVYEGQRFRIGDQIFETGMRVPTMIMDETLLPSLKPYNKFWPGWKCCTSSCGSASELPEELRKLIRVVEAEVGPVAIISVGPDRRQTLAWE